MNQLLRFLFGLALAFSCPICAYPADHGHLNAGAIGTQQNDKLIFENASDFVSSSGYVKTLTYTNASTYAGYYHGNLTMTALAQTPAHAGPVPNAPALGSFIQVQLVSVEGPALGEFGFWEAGATAPTFSLLSGLTGTNMWRVTESDGSSGSDPYGHVHGRRLTATKPGIYKVGFKLFDTSTNGAGQGPIHAPSDVITIYFQAGVNLQFVETDANRTHVRFSAPAGYDWQLESSSSLDEHARWLPLGNPVAGDDYFHEFKDDHPAQGQQFYRTKSVEPQLNHDDQGSARVSPDR
jgi:hypothetical protein